MKEIQKAHITQVEIAKHDLEGAYSAVDHVDTTTGEVLLEANHDLEMLRDGPYPWAVKQRVLSRVGHLSNDATADFLLKDYDGGAAHIILAHLSENNNLPELAKLAVERALCHHPSLLGNRLLIASQQEPLEPVSF